MFDQTSISGAAQLCGNAELLVDSCVSGNAKVCETAVLTDSAHATDDCQVGGYACLRGASVVGGSATISGQVSLFDAPTIATTAHITAPEDVLSMVVAAASGETITAYRCRTGHRIHYGDWDGGLDEFRAEISRRAETEWPKAHAHAATLDRWRYEFDQILNLLASRVEFWDN